MFLVSLFHERGLLVATYDRSRSHSPCLPSAHGVVASDAWFCDRVVDSPRSLMTDEFNSFRCDKIVDKFDAVSLEARSPDRTGLVDNLRISTLMMRRKVASLNANGHACG